jgi:2-amino-4-hydroxy-6-hydroxymethyldihydropteridine diphosphokinase
MGDDRARPVALGTTRRQPPPILIGLGANLGSRRCGAPQQTLAAALAVLGTSGVLVVARSRWYRSAPLPRSGQPFFVNAVASVKTARGPRGLLALMQAVERRFGRRRGVRNAPRTLDLDLLDYQGECVCSPRLTLPHPGSHERRFVLEPIAEIAPSWRHPIFRLTARELLARHGDEQCIKRLGHRISRAPGDCADRTLPL